MMTTGSSVPGKISAQHGGCSGCQWSLTIRCSTGVGGHTGGFGDYCGGPLVGCKPAEKRFIVYFAPDPESPLQRISEYCYPDNDGGVISAATVTADARRYAGQLAVAKPGIRAWPPDGTTLVNLPTFFAVAAPGSGQHSFGGQGYTMQLQVQADGYDWSFGDGAGMHTTDPGSGPPSGSVRHTYAAARTVTVSVQVEYGATYTILTPGGRIGPLPVDGGPVRTVPAQTTLQVHEALATLTG